MKAGLPMVKRREMKPNDIQTQTHHHKANDFYINSKKEESLTIACELTEKANL